MPLGWRRKNHGNEVEARQGSFEALGVDTPAVVLREYLGMLPYCPPYLAREVESMHGAVLGQCELSSAVDIIGGKEDIRLRDLVQGNDPEGSKLLRVYKNQNLRLMSPRSLLHGPASISGEKLQIDGGGGRRTISIAEYVDKINLETPGMVVSPADEVHMESTGKNRSGRALERSVKLFDEFVETLSKKRKSKDEDLFVFRTIVASTKPGSLQEQLGTGEGSSGGRSDTFHGVVAGSTNLGESDEAFRGFLGSVREAAHGKSLLVQSCNSLHRILLALSGGADLISSDLPALLTKQGHALFLDWIGLNDNLTPCPVNASNREPSSKRQKKEASVLSLSREDVDKATDGAPLRVAERRAAVANMWDERYFRDKGPLLPACQCHACAHHTRAYLHHLLKSKELLAEVLLYTHNQHQLLLLFQEARKHIATDAMNQHSSESSVFKAWIQRIRDTYLVQ